MRGTEGAFKFTDVTKLGGIANTWKIRLVIQKDLDNMSSMPYQTRWSSVARKVRFCTYLEGKPNAPV